MNVWDFLKIDLYLYRIYKVIVNEIFEELLLGSRKSFQCTFEYIQIYIQINSEGNKKEPSIHVGSKNTF